MKRIVVPAAIILCVFWFYSCTKPGREISDVPGVAVSVFPVYDIARNICGDKAFPFFVIPAGADPHTFEPLPSVASELRNVSLFIGVTREFDGWIERYLPERAVRRYLISPDAGSTHTANPH